jgi:hypothetical protein
MIDVWRDIYNDCIHAKQIIERDIFNKEKEIEKLKQKLKENENFFQKNFNETIDNCIGISYNKYIKERKEVDTNGRT